MNWLENHGAKRFAYSDRTPTRQFWKPPCAGRASRSSPNQMNEVCPVSCGWKSTRKLPRVSIYLVYHCEVRRVPRVRLVVDALVAALRDALR
jgi:hypothetical protein